MASDGFEQATLTEVIRKRETALFDNQAQLRQSMDDLLESQRVAHVGTWRLDVATNEVVWSEGLYKLYGFDPTIPPPPYTEHMKLFTAKTGTDYRRLLNAPAHREYRMSWNWRR